MEYIFTEIRTFIGRFEQLLIDNTKALERAATVEKQLRKEAEANQLLTTDQAREYLGGVSLDAMEYYQKRNLPFYSKGKLGKWYRRGDIDEWLKAGQVNRHTK